MNMEVEAVELQFIKITKQIQREKEICNDLTEQLEKIRDSCKYIKNNNEIKNSLITSTSIGIKCSGNNVLSLKTSLDITSGLEHELKKMMELPNNEIKNNFFMERLWNYENQWERTKNLYKKLPTANEALELQLITKQMLMEVQIKTRKITDTKLLLKILKNLKERRIKAQIINLANLSLTSKISFKKKLGQKQKLRSLIANNNKIKIEQSSLVGKKQDASMSNVIFRIPTTEEGFAVPHNYGIMGNKFIPANMYQRSPFGLCSHGQLSVPQLMIPTFNPEIYQNICEATAQALSDPSYHDGTVEQTLRNVIDGNNAANFRKRTIEGISMSNPYMNMLGTKEQTLNVSRNENTYPEQECSEHGNNTLNFRKSNIEEISMPIPYMNMLVTKEHTMNVSRNENTYPEQGCSEYGNNAANFQKRKIENISTSSPYMSMLVSKEQTLNVSRNENTYPEQGCSESWTSKPNIRATNDAGNLSYEMSHVGIHNSGRSAGPNRPYKYHSQAMKEVPPRQNIAPLPENAIQHYEVQNFNFSPMDYKNGETETNFNFGPRGFQAVLENGNANIISKSAASGFEKKGKSTNVWDIFN